MDYLKEVKKLFSNWEESIVDYSPKIVMALVILIISYFIAKLVKSISRKFYTRVFKKRQDIAKVASIILYFFFLLSGVFLALEVLGLESVLTKLIAGAGIVGIVAGFAFKDIASNAFAGFLLSIQKPFKYGDWIELEDAFGTIQEVGWITTSVKTVSGQEVFVPNQLVYSNAFTNYSSFTKRRVILKSGVSYGDDLELVRRVALEEAQQVTGILKNEEVDFYFTEIGSSSYNFELRFWIKFTHQKDYLQAMNDIIVRVKIRFEAEDISLAYAVTSLDFGVKGGVNIYDNPIHVKP